MERTETQEDKERLATAYHEAGHAVMALLLGRSVDKISVVRNSIRLGAVQLGKGRTGRRDDHFENEAMILLAGLVSEQKHTGKYNWQGAHQDLLALRSLSLSRVANDEDALRLERKLLDKASYLLEQDRNWFCIERIVTELMERGVVRGRSARHHFDEAQRKFDS
jgi:hypothetical protein